MEVLSPKAVWKDFDPKLLELDTTTVKQYEKDSTTFIEVYFNGNAVDDGTSRLYAVTAVPTAVLNDQKIKKLSTVIIVPDIGKPIDPCELERWASLGYCAFSVDNYGENSEGLYSIYPKSLDYANYLRNDGYLKSAAMGAKHTCFYEWALNLRRGITYLESLPFVEPSEIGICGFLHSCAYLWQVIAMEDRLKTSAMVFADSWHEIDVSDDERECWMAGVAPQAYAFFAQTPILFVACSNDFQNNMDRSFDVLNRIPDNVDHRLSVSERCIDKIGDKQSKNLDTWFSIYLKNKSHLLNSPKIAYAENQGKFCVNIVVDEPSAVKSVELFYANDMPVAASRNFLSATVTQTTQENVFSAEVKVVNVSHPIVAFANVLYKNGLCLTSNLIKSEPSKYNITQTNVKKSPIIYNNSMGMSSFTAYVPDCDSYVYTQNPVKLTTGAANIKGVCGLLGSLATFAIGDINIEKGEDALLVMDICSKNAQNIYINVLTGIAQPNAKTATAEVQLTGGELWQKVVLSVSDFKCNGKPIESWDEVNMLYIVSNENILLNNMLFA